MKTVNKILTFLRVRFFALLFKIVFEKPEHSGVQCYKYAFHFKPRKIGMGILVIIMLPFVFLLRGVIGCIEFWKRCFELHEHPSFFIKMYGTTEKELYPNRWECYKMM